MPFDVIAVTARTHDLATTLTTRLLTAAEGATVLPVADPSSVVPMGPGAATLNALLVVAEDLSARAGAGTLTSEPLQAARVLILHVGGKGRGGSPHPCLPQALTTMPLKTGVMDDHDTGELLCGAEWVLGLCKQLFANAPPGVVVVSTDSVLTLPPRALMNAHNEWLVLHEIDGSACAGAVIAVPTSISCAALHGVCEAAPRPPGSSSSCPTSCGSIAYRADRAALEAIASKAGLGGQVPLFTGLVWFSAAGAEALLELQARSPLDACTDAGIDAGAKPMWLGFHDDILGPLLSSTHQEEYLAAVTDSPMRRRAREVLWTTLRRACGGVGMRLCTAPAGTYLYCDGAAAWRDMLLAPPRDLNLPTPTAPGEASTTCGSSQLTSTWLRSYQRGVFPDRSVSARAAAQHGAGRSCALSCLLATDVRLGGDVALEHCELRHGTIVGGGTLLSGVVSAPAGVVWPEAIAAFEVPLTPTDADAATSALLVHGMADDLMAPPSAALCECIRKGLLRAQAADGGKEPTASVDALLWGASGSGAVTSAGSGSRVLWTANLFAVVPSAEGLGAPSAWPLSSWLLDPQGVPPPEWFGAERISFAAAAQRIDVAAWLGRQRALACRIDLAVLGARLSGAQHAVGHAEGQTGRGGESPEVEPVGGATVATTGGGSSARTAGLAVRLLLERMAMGPPAEFDTLLGSLDALAAEATPLVAARIFAAIAEALALRASGHGGLRSGPAANPAWAGALHKLRDGDVRGATASLAAVRSSWLRGGSTPAGPEGRSQGNRQQHEPRTLVRAARHYEGAAAECISLCVRTCAVAEPPHVPPVPIGVWVTSSAPARIDLAGGWTDTPPVCYEHGGLVINAAVTVDGACPIGSRARRLAEPKVIITVEHVDGSKSTIECTCLQDLADYCSPLAPGALPKTALLFVGVVSLDQQGGGGCGSLAEQLAEAGGGIEIESWSRLPTGSGMGTSSILAATLVACIGRCTGRDYDAHMLVHAVVNVEQMLTTGGGWQDQVGGVFGAIKRCASDAVLPLSVQTTQLPTSPDGLRLLSSHLQLVYTGKTRLARNLLQDVLRRWYSAHPAILANVKALVTNARALEDAIHALDMQQIGACLDTYWAQKKVMCDAEPASVTRVLAKLRPLCHGASLAGAGGGGFMLLVTKEPDVRAAVEAALADEPCTVHTVAIHEGGLQTTVG